ncbi:hypothetical protein [Streptomyces noursei]|uniref:hypothetical protein n=1 Tax=Streptomyces noursei TaxID=1971 RepID=UPI0023B7945C|nr:hypothetical protein [Streptomyces noursei]
MRASHPLLTFFTDAAAGRFPPVDGRVTVLPSLPRGLACSVAFTGHAVVAAAMSHRAVHAQGSLLAEALSLVPAGEPVFAAVSPGNARSLRAFLACGFTPIGSEVLLRPERD